MMITYTNITPLPVQEMLPILAAFQATYPDTTIPMLEDFMCLPCRGRGRRRVSKHGTDRCWMCNGTGWKDGINPLGQRG